MIPVGAYARVSEDKALRTNAADWREIGEQAAEQFKDMDALAAESIRAVMVHPAGRGRRFDPSLIEVVWIEGGK
ncbi:hypothetical protein OG379_24935 [Streptomyces sp. NBC_01166]|uniref:hypothetical protein n=1 Tax=Streptomyces sp. NBC_01166 TaxID=2903755 RepID=UPI00386A13FA|nr:hypothetical protein OG379_24935 [Streptomyces sp. NBC_01166]